MEIETATFANYMFSVVWSHTYICIHFHLQQRYHHNVKYLFWNHAHILYVLRYT